MLSDETFEIEVVSANANATVRLTHRASGRSREKHCEVADVAKAARELRAAFVHSVIGPVERVMFHQGRADGGDVVWAEHESGVRTQTHIARNLSGHGPQTLVDELVGRMLDASSDPSQ